MNRKAWFGGRAAFSCQSAGLILLFGAQLLLARLLGADSFGVYAYVNAWLVVLGIGARFGLDTVALRDGGIMASRGDWGGVRQLTDVAGKWMISSGVLLAIILVAFVLVLVPSDQQELRATFLIGAAILPLQAWSALRSSVLLALGRVWSGLGPDFLLRPVLLALVVIFIDLVFPESGAVVAMVAALAAALMVLVIGQLLLSRALPRDGLQPSRKLVRGELLGSATSFLLFNGSSQFLYQIDTIVVGLMISPGVAGGYYIAKQLALVASIALIAQQTSAAPRLAALKAEGKVVELQALLGGIAWRGFLFSLVYFAGILVLGRFALSVFGERFVAAYPPLLVLSIGQVGAAAIGAVGQMAAMAGLQLLGGVTYLVSALAFAAVASIVIPKYGVMGAAITAAVVTISWNVALCFFVAQKLGVSTAVLGAKARKSG